MTKTNTNKKETLKGGEKEIFYYIVYEYNELKNDIEYITSKKDLASAINCINGLLLANGDNINIIKDITSIIKNRHINKYITLDIENLKIINKYIIFKQYENEKENKKYILSKLEKDAITNNDIFINRLYKKELINYQYNKKKQTIKTKPMKTRTLNEKDKFKKILQLKTMLKNKEIRKHENKNFLKGGVIYE